MKFTNKKYILGLSFLACLILGVVFGKSIISQIYHPSVIYMDIPSHLYIGGGIPVYAQEAPTIIIGEVKNIGEPIHIDNGTITQPTQQEINIDVTEVLKGDTSIKNISVFTNIEKTVDGVPVAEVSFKQGEKVLLFLGEDFSGNYVTFAGPAGKYIIDNNDNVSSSSGSDIFLKISLADAKTKISDAMKAPPMIKHNSEPTPFSGEVSPK
jgi:hypothetical protein